MPTYKNISSQRLLLKVSTLDLKTLNPGETVSSEFLLDSEFGLERTSDLPVYNPVEYSEQLNFSSINKEEQIEFRSSTNNVSEIKIENLSNDAIEIFFNSIENLPSLVLGELKSAVVRNISSHRPLYDKLIIKNNSAIGNVSITMYKLIK